MYQYRHGYVLLGQDVCYKMNVSFMTSLDFYEYLVSHLYHIYLDIFETKHVDLEYSGPKDNNTIYIMMVGKYNLL